MARAPLPGWELSIGKMGLYYLDTPKGTLYGNWSSAHYGWWYIEDEHGHDIGYIDDRGNFRDPNGNLV
jgi:hypothetical protein